MGLLRACGLALALLAAWAIAPAAMGSHITGRLQCDAGHCKIDLDNGDCPSSLAFACSLLLADRITCPANIECAGLDRAASVCQDLAGSPCWRGELVPDIDDASDAFQLTLPTGAYTFTMAQALASPFDYTLCVYPPFGSVLSDPEPGGAPEVVTATGMSGTWRILVTSSACSTSPTGGPGAESGEAVRSLTLALPGLVGSAAAGCPPGCFPANEYAVGVA